MNQEKSTVPSNLNVLTILTFLGSAYALFGGIKNYLTGCDSIDDFDQAMDKIDMNEMPAFFEKMFGFLESMMVAMCDNKLIFLIATVVTSLLCAAGALLMRKLKKQGFIIYVVGELLMPVISCLLFANSAMSAVFLFVSGMIVPIIFIILYAKQRKHLIY